jgi:hypothetical protein
MLNGIGVQQLPSIPKASFGQQTEGFRHRARARAMPRDLEKLTSRILHFLASLARHNYDFCGGGNGNRSSRLHATLTHEV